MVVCPLDYQLLKIEIDAILEIVVGQDKFVDHNKTRYSKVEKLFRFFSLPNIPMKNMKR